MIVLHNQKGLITEQIRKDFGGKDVALLASNILQTSGTEWQTLVKFRKSNVGFLPKEFGFGLSLHNAGSKEEAFTLELSEAEAKAKLRSWGHSAVEADNLINKKMEVE